MRERLVSLTKELVDRPSENPPGQEEDVAVFIEDYLTTSDVPFDVELDYLEPGRPNIIARVGDPTQGSFLFTGHLDVVPADAEGWDTPPFNLQIENDRLVGRGVADMKAAVAAMILAAERYWMTEQPTGELVLAFVMGEETGGIGSEGLVANGIKADGAILGEPTDLALCIAQKGVLRYTVTVEGVSSHASVPEQGVNAVQGIRHIIDSLEQFDTQQRNQTTHELLSPECVTPTLIEGGTKANVVPRTATLHLDWRILPGKRAVDDYNELLTEVLDKALMGTPYEASWNRYRVIEGLEIPQSTPIVEAVSAAANDVNLPVTLLGFNAATDARYFIHSANIPTLLFGPGSIERDAHTVNESISIDDLETAYDVYFHTLHRFFDTNGQGNVAER